MGTICRSALACWMLLPAPLVASEFDNESGYYQLQALPDAGFDAERRDRMQWCDQQPSGRHVRAGEWVRIEVGELPPDHQLTALVGFRPMWGSDLGQQEEELDSGHNRFRAEQDGPLLFRFTAPDEDPDSSAEVEIQVAGGRPLPLFDHEQMDASDWQDELAAHGRAPYVQLLSARALITLPRRVHDEHPVVDPDASFAVIHEMLELQDALSGFDDRAALHGQPRLRAHYLVDFRASEADRQQFYMYATDQFIGMLPDNSAELTDPEQLRREWGIWHETGHLHQQHSWTPEPWSEITVNLYSLRVQEAFGQPSTLRQREDGAPSFYQRARDYLDEGAGDLLAEPEEDDLLFIRLVLFHQLARAYGWELYAALSRHFREHPLDAEASDQDKADAMVLALCRISGNDLRPFFARWGLRLSPATVARIGRLKLPVPSRDPATLF